MEAHAEPNLSSPVVRTVQPNRFIEGNDRSEAVTVTVRAGQARALRAASSQCLWYGDIAYMDYETPQATRSVRIERGDLLDVVGDAAEAIRCYKNEAGVFCDCFGEMSDVQIDRKPINEVWVRLVPREGRPAGWVNVSQPDISMIGCEGGEGDIGD